MSNKRIEPLLQRAIDILRQNPDININEFKNSIGKSYAHSGNLMSLARKQLGLTVLTKVAKTMAMLAQRPEIKGREFRELLGVKSQRAGELRHIARKRLEAGVFPSKEALEWLESRTNAPQQTHEQKPMGKATKVRNSKPAVTAQSTATGAMAVQSVQRLPKNPRELIEESGLNPDEWYVSSQIVNRWEIGAKHPDTNEILVEPLYQTKVRLEPIGAVEGIAEALKAYIAELKESAPTLPEIHHATIVDGHLAEISIPDLHVGKYASSNETGESYNLDIACDVFRSALHDLISQCTAGYPVEKILFPIGNDFLNGDNLCNSTTRGTPQDAAGNFKEHFRAGMNLLREGIETLRTIAPVEVVIVPGNHDSLSSFALGQLIGAIYESCTDVTVHDSTDQPRTYISFGNVLLGFAHGHSEKARDLPMLMAFEASQAWGSALHREFHVGHLHHTRDTHYMGTNEKDGVIHRVIPSLSSADRWHADKGYRSQRAALAFVYHRTEGQRAIFRHAILDRLKLNVAQIA
jgi:hypothetical protein